MAEEGEEQLKDNELWTQISEFAHNIYLCNTSSFCFYLVFIIVAVGKPHALLVSVCRRLVFCNGTADLGLGCSLWTGQLLRARLRHLLWEGFPLSEIGKDGKTHVSWAPVNLRVVTLFFLNFFAVYFFLLQVMPDLGDNRFFVLGSCSLSTCRLFLRSCCLQYLCGSPSGVLHS